MGGGGGKGGSQSTSVTIPKWLEDAAKANLAKADTLSEIGYTPYYGPDVAALTPMQTAAMDNTNAAASAFGMDAPVGSGMPPPQTYADGVQGYSSGGLYDQALAELQRRMPGQYDALRAPFLDPFTGAAPAGNVPLVPPPSRGQQGQTVVWDNRSADSKDNSPARSTSGASGGSFASSGLASRAPGGVNTRNPGGAINQAVARATSGSTRTPTSANRPQSRSTR